MMAGVRHDPANLARPGRYLTPPQIGRMYGVSSEKVLGWIRAGELDAVNVAGADSSRPRFVVSPEALSRFERRRSGGQRCEQPARRRKLENVTEYY